MNTHMLRITPARAGKTTYFFGYSYLYQDHPRSCGKDPLVASGSGLVLGSPPLVRERHDALADIRQGHGITPARAGKTVS